MKKILTTLFILSLLSFRTADVQKTYKVEGTVEFWQSLVNDLDNSNIPHDRVKVYLQAISSQVQKQIADTTHK